MAKGQKTGGRAVGSKNRVLTPEELAEKAKTVELKARIRLAKQGVVLDTLLPRQEYKEIVKPGQRDLTDRPGRVQCAIEAMQRIDQIVAERAASPLMADVPGGRSGYVTFNWQRKAEKKYVKVSRFDQALYQATESLLRYIAAERGQLNPKSEVALLLEEKEKKPVNYSCLSNEDFAEYRRIALILHAEREGKRVVNSVIEDESKDGTGQSGAGKRAVNSILEPGQNAE
jgi:hypothetical protein